MPRPNELYYAVNNEHIVYNTEPGGSIEIVNGQVLWKKINASKIYKPKALIITDWSAMGWSVPKIFKIQQEFVKLLNEGFSLYVWQDGDVIKLEQTDLDRLNEIDFCKRITPETPEIIKTQVLHQHDLTYDMLHLLDDYWIDALLCSDAAPQQRMFDFFSAYWAWNQQQLLNLLHNAQPPYSGLILPEDYQESLLQHYLAHLPATVSLHQETSCNDCSLNQEAVSHVIQTGELLFENKTPVTPEQINRLMFEGQDVSEDSLLTALDHIPTLYSLVLSNYNALTGFFSNNKSFPLLYRLEIINCPLSMADIQKLSVLTPNLKKLVLERCDTLDLDFSGNNLFANLASLTVNNITHFNLGSLNSLTGLRTLDLFGDIQFYGALPAHLPQLRVLRVNGKTDGGIVQQLLRAATKLQVLELIKQQELPAGFTIGLDLKSLTHLQINHCNLEADDLCRLLAMSGKIQELEINQQTLPEGFTHQLNLSALRVLVLDNCNLFQSDLMAIKQRANRLHFFNFMQCPVDNIASQPFFFPECRELYLSTPSLQGEDIAWTIQSANRLRTLHLYSYPIPDNFAYRLPMTQLQFMTLEYCHINAGTLIQLIHNNPDLFFLHLRDCTNLEMTPELCKALARIPDVVLDEMGPPLASSSMDAQRPAPNYVDMMQRFTPWKPDTPFLFKGENQSKDQDMIVEKLCQYFTLQQRHLNSIPLMQNGICHPLSRWFLDSSPDEWQHILSRIQAWNGQADQLDTELGTLFERLWHYVHTYQLAQRMTYLIPENDPFAEQLLADNIQDYLRQNDHSAVFKNVWHAIGVKVMGQDLYLVQDPNFKDGPMTVSRDHLLPLLIKQLGPIISVYAGKTWPAQINDANEFIRQGGLLTLIPSNNVDTLIPALPVNIAPWALTGITLRSMNGMPAWLTALEHFKTVGLGLGLLASFIASNPGTWKIYLRSSLEATPDASKNRLIDWLQKLHYSDRVLIRRLINVLSHQRDLHPELSRHLQTWERKKTTPLSVESWCQTLLDDDKESVLVEMTNSPDLRALSWHIQAACQSRSQPYFYVHSPRDLICSADYLQRDGQQAQLHPGPGGPMYDFLSQAANANEPYILLINYDNFDNTERQRFNALLPTDGHIDGIARPANLRIIAVLNTNKTGYAPDNDFRFVETQRNPCEDYALPPLPFVEASADQPVNLLKLYHATDWQEHLIERLQINGDRFLYQEGSLSAALQSGLPIQIQKGLWENPEFLHCWYQALLPQGGRVGSRQVQLPADVKLIKNEDYDWPALTQFSTWDRELLPGAELVNQSLLQQAFHRHHCDNQTRRLNTLVPGLIEAAAGQELHLNVSGELNEDQWAQLLDACQTHQVKLRCHLAHHVHLPPALAALASPPEDSIAAAWNQQSTDNTLIIDSNDADSSIALLTPGWLVFDISEAQANDLLIRLEKGDGPFDFSEREGALLHALRHGRRVVLKGDFKPALLDALMPLLLSRQHAANPPGQLALIGRGLAALAPARHVVDAACKKQVLLDKQYTSAEINQLSETHYQQEPLARLITRLNFMRQHPGQHSDLAWQGLEGIPLAFDLGEFNPEHSAEHTAQFRQDRRQAVNDKLEHSPYVFLTGLTGTGKTTSTEQDLIGEHDVLYRGEQAMEDWAKDCSDKRKILFIDEANLSARQWSDLEGLFNNPPGIIINGTWYPLSDKHKIVFAGNPLNYGGGRNIAEFFQRHGQALVFEPLPLNFIYEAILKPVFQHTPLETRSADLANPLLDVYRYLCQCSTDEVLISPRELQTMALLCLSACERHPQLDPQAVARYYAFQLGKSLVPPSYSVHFNQIFSAPAPDLPRQSGLVLTKSRQPASMMFDDVLKLRQRRLDNPGNDAQQYGGLGGLVFEGSSSVDNLAFVMGKLKEHGFSEDGPYGRRFYFLPASMPLSDKKRLLLRAFHEGALALVENMNSSPALERFVNDLFMGKSPEGQTLRPEQPGFLCIATQLPVTAANVSKTGNAMARRIIKVELPEHSPDDLRGLLVQRGIAPAQAKIMVNTYLEKIRYAKANQLSPLPDVSSLLRMSESNQPGFWKTKPAAQPDSLAGLEEELRALQQADKYRIKAGLEPEHEERITLLQNINVKF